MPSAVSVVLACSPSGSLPSGKVSSQVYPSQAGSRNWMFKYLLELKVLLFVPVPALSSILPEIIGAITAQFYLIPRFGAKQWKLYATVISAGFSCGMGLIGMASVAIAMIQRSVTQLPF